MNQKNFSFSVVVPTLNAERFLSTCLTSIIDQEYPKNKIEILVSDGGSTDDTRKIAKKFGAQILENKKTLAEPGVDLGLRKAKHDLSVVLAADNELKGIEWFKKINLAFQDKGVFAAYPKQVNHPADSWLTKYVNTFTDPFNHFVYGKAANTRTFSQFYRIRRKTKDYLIFDFSLVNHPILALAQGFVVRKGFKRPRGMEHDDILPILKIIEEEGDMAYVPRAEVYHHTIKDLRHFVKKQRWAVDNALLNRGYGVVGRQQYFTFFRKLRAYFWPFYSVSLFLPLLRTVYGGLLEKDKNWIYHPIINLVAGLVFWQEIFKIKVLGKRISRKGKP